MISCKCGHWYNISIKCPTCGTVANNKYNDVGKIRNEALQNMINKRYREKRRLILEIRDLEKEVTTNANKPKEKWKLKQQPK